MSIEPDNISPDGLENFFRKKVEDYHFDFDENNWQRLERCLDEEKASSRHRKFVPYGRLLIVLLLFLGSAGGGLLGTYLFHLSSSKSLQTFKKRGSTQSKDSLLPYSKRNPIPMDTSEALLEEVSTRSQSRVSSQAEEKALLLSSNLPPLPHQFAGVYVKGIVSDAVSRYEGGQFIQLPLESENYRIQEKVYQALASDTANYLKSIPATWFVDSVKFIEARTSIGALSESSSKPQKLRKEWGMIFSISPEFNAVNMTFGNQAGPQLGLQAFVQLGQRWQIRGGLVLSNKRYTAPTDFYTLPEYYWTINANGNRPENIEATCNVLELPVQALYYVKLSGRGRWYVGAGLSSYWMLQENYKYQYAQDNPNWISETSIRNKNVHGLSAGQVLLGYEWVMSRRLAFQAEPFVKLPLSKIGFPKVRLYSMGLSLNIKYSFNKR